MIYDKLFDWQKSIVDKHKDDYSLGLFLEMGLGKTVISLALAEAKKATNILIITIKAKVDEPEELEGSWRYWASQIENNPSITICNYESLYRKDQEARSKYKKYGFLLKDPIKDFISKSRKQDSVIIIDESHRVKNMSSNNCRVVKKIVRECKTLTGIYVLTGTPYHKKYEDIITQLQLLGADITKTEFIRRWCILGNNPGLLSYQQPIVGYKNEEELIDYIHRFSISIKKEEVVNLPDKIFNKILIPNTKEFDLYTLERIGGKKNPNYRNMHGYIAETIGSAYLRSREICSGFLGNGDEYVYLEKSRLNKLRSILEEEPNNYVIFYNFQPEFFEIFDICNQLEYNIDVYNGDIKDTFFYDRYDENTIFSNTKNVLLIQFSSGSTGKNFQKYNNCIVYSLPDYANWAQGIDRLHRIGQNKTVIYNIIIMNNWLDWRRWESIQLGEEYTENLYKSDEEKNRYK